MHTALRIQRLARSPQPIQPGRDVEIALAVDRHAVAAAPGVEVMEDPHVRHTSVRLQVVSTDHAGAVLVRMRLYQVESLVIRRNHKPVRLVDIRRLEDLMDRAIGVDPVDRIDVALVRRRVLTRTIAEVEPALAIEGDIVRLIQALALEGIGDDLDIARLHVGAGESRVVGLGVTAFAGDWGIDVPGDPDQVMYVWVDALANYITALDFNEDSENFRKYWSECPRRIHVIGKGINRFHTIYWPAILISAGLPVPTEVFVHGYLTINGQKISKSLGNVIDPMNQVQQFGVDPVRYYLLRAISPTEDGDYSEKRFEEVYNADLANNLGNLARRVETIGAKAGFTPPDSNVESPPDGYHEAMADWKFNDALATLWRRASDLNQRIEEAKPWELQKAGKDPELESFLAEMVTELRRIGYWLKPFMPGTSERLMAIFEPGKPIKRGEPLFPRLGT